MSRFVEGDDRAQGPLLPSSLEEIGKSTDAHARFVSLAVKLAELAMSMEIPADGQNAFFKARLEQLESELNSWLPKS